MVHSDVESVALCGRGIPSFCGRPAYTPSSAITKFVLGGRHQAHSFAVAAPVRSGAPVRRHQSLMAVASAHPEPA